MNVSRTKLVGLAVVIFAATIWLFWPCVHGDFLRGDDREYLRQAVRWNGVTWNGVKWAFTEISPYYQALPRLSLLLDYQIWGANAAGYHATNVVLHALNAALVFGFLWTLLGASSLTVRERLAVALGVAGVFAIHPLQVESAAWIAGRTQLLCTTFGICCLWAYVVGARRWVVWGLYVAAVLSKPMAVSFPFVMLAMDYYPLRRHEQLGWGRLAWEKASLLALAVAASLATLIMVTLAGSTMARGDTAPVLQHVLLMFRSLAFYSWKLVWPVPSSPYYPMRLALSLDQWPVLVSALYVGAITALAVWYRRRLPALAAAWGAYLALLLPVSVLIGNAWETTPPRYAYMAILPLLLVAGGAAVWLWRSQATIMRVVVACLLACEVCVFGASTYRQVPVWRNDETVWRAVLELFPDWEIANSLVTLGLLDQGKAREALECAQRFAQIAPQRCEPHNLLGQVFAQLGRLPDAVRQYEEALRINPKFAQAHVNLGAAMGKLGKPEGAIREYEEALRIDPDNTETHINLGIVLMQENRIQEAIGHYEKALRLDSHYAAAAHVNLANALLLQGSVPDAIRHYEQALRIAPEDAQAHDNLGIALARAGNVSEAKKHWEEALRLSPDDVEAHMNLGHALEKQGRAPEAIEHYQQALKLRPDLTPARDALARLGAVQ